MRRLGWFVETRPLSEASQDEQSIVRKCRNGDSGPLRDDPQAAVVRREFFPAPSSGGQITEEAAWRDYGTDGHVLGPTQAPVTIVEFSDFECPACRRLSFVLDSLRDQDSSSVKLVYRHFPLWQHRWAVTAIRASECAHLQGRFDAMHDALFQHQDSLGAAEPRFDACVRSDTALPSLHRDTLAGHTLGVNSTPTFLVSNLRVSGALRLDELKRLIRRAR